MPSIFAIISKSIFERDFGQGVCVGDVLPLDAYRSKGKAFDPLREGGDLFLVTARPEDRLWLVAILETPTFGTDGLRAAAPNTVPVTDLSELIPKVKFSTGKGINAKPGKLGMSLQTPRRLSDDDIALIRSRIAVSGPPARSREHHSTKPKQRSEPRSSSPAGGDHVARIEVVGKLLEDDPKGALQALVTLWRETKWASLAHLVDALGTSRESAAADELRRAGTVPQKEWLQLAAEGDLADRGALALTASMASSKQAAARFRAMVDWNDPRANQAALALLPRDVWTSTGARPVWTAVYKILQTSIDPRLLHVVDEMGDTDDRVQKVVAATRKAFAGLPEPPPEAHAALGALEASFVEHGIVSAAKGTASLESATFEDVAFAGARAHAFWPTSLHVPFGLDRRNGRTLVGYLDTPSTARPHRFACVALLDDEARTLWASARGRSIAALSPSGQRVASLTGRAPRSGEGDGFPVHEGQEVLELHWVDVEPRSGGVAPVPIPALSTDEAPYNFTSCVRGLSFVGESTLAVLAGAPASGDRERMLLWTYDIEAAVWTLIHDEAPFHLDAATVFATADGYIVVHEAWIPRHGWSSVRIFERTDDGFRLRQSYEQPNCEQTGALYRDIGRWIVPHPTSGFLQQVFGEGSLSTYDWVNNPGALVHVEARTGFRTRLGDLAADTRFGLSSDGRPHCYGIRGGNVRTSTLVSDGSEAESAYPKLASLDHLAPGVLSISEGGTLHLVDIETTRSEHDLETASALVDALHVCPDGSALVARVGTTAALIEGKAIRTSQVKSSSPSVVATADGITVWAPGSTAQLKHGGRNIAKIKLGAGPMLGNPATPGAFLGLADAVEAVVFDVASKQITSRERFEPGAKPVCVGCDQSGTRLIVGSSAGQLSFHCSGTVESIATVDVGAPPHQVGMHANTLRAIALVQGRLRWWNVDDDSLTDVEHPEGSGWAGLACHPTKPWAAYVDTDGGVFIHDIERDTLSPVARHTPGTHQLAFASDRLYVGGGRAEQPRRETVVVYDLETSA